MAIDPTRLRPVSPDDDLTPEELDARERQPMRLQPVAPTSDSGRLSRVSDTETPSAPVSSGPPRAGSAADAQARLERIQGEKRPWSELGTGGKIGRVFSTIGNVAGDIVAPATMRLIPGTDLNRSAREEQAREELGAARKQESLSGLQGAEAVNQLSEADVRKNPQGKTADEQALAARQRILATPEGQQPDPKDVSTWKAYADLENAKQAPKGEDEGKQPIGDEGVAQHGKELETLTAGMNAQDKTKFMDAYKAGPKDTHATATKRLEDAKAAAQLSGSERDRALQRDIAAKNHADQQSHQQLETSSEVVRAVDKNGKVHLLPRGDYESNKDQYSGSVIKMTPEALTKATDHATIINEMQGRTNALAESAQRMNWDDKGQLNIVKQALNQVNHSYADSIIGIPITKFMSDNLKQLGLEGATPETRRYIVSLLSLREAALGLPKEITGGSRVSDISANALWETLPSQATPNVDWAMDHLRALQSTVDRLKESRVPVVPGMPDVHKDVSLYQHHYQSKAGEIFSDDGKNWVDKNGNSVGK